MVVVTLNASKGGQIRKGYRGGSQATWRSSGGEGGGDFEQRARRAFESWSGPESGEGEAAQRRLTTHQAKNALISLLGYRASKVELHRLCGFDGATWEVFYRRVRERHSEVDCDEEARQAFKALDRSCNSFLSLSDVRASFREALPNVPSNVVEQVFFELDSDRDGRLNYNRFREMWLSSE